MREELRELQSVIDALLGGGVCYCAEEAAD